MFNWFFVIGGALVVALGSRQIMSGDSSSIVDTKRYTDDSVRDFIKVEGFLYMMFGAGFLLQGLSGLDMLPKNLQLLGVAITAISVLMELLAIKIVLTKRF